jgi:hypothetical protein
MVVHKSITGYIDSVQKCKFARDGSVSSLKPAEGYAKGLLDTITTYLRTK